MTISEFYNRFDPHGLRKTVHINGKRMTWKQAIAQHGDKAVWFPRTTWDRNLKLHFELEVK